MDLQSSTASVSVISSQENEPDDEQETENLDELCFPSVSNQIGRAAEWAALLGAYRRAAGVPDSRGGGASFLEDIDEHAWDDEELEEDDHTFDHQSLASSHADASMGCQVAVLQGPAGSGKSFLVQKLYQCMADSFEFNFGNCPEDRTPTKHHGAASYHDDTTISTKSGGFLNHNLQPRPRPRFGGDGDDEEEEEEVNFAELPTGLFAQGSFHHGSSHSPYSAFTESFDNILEQLIFDDLVDLDSLQTALVNALQGSHETLQRLVAIVPNLALVLEQDESCPRDELRDRFDENDCSRPSVPSPVQRTGSGVGLSTGTPFSHLHSSFDPEYASAPMMLEPNSHPHSNLLVGTAMAEQSLLSTDSPKGVQFLLKSFLKALAKIVQTYYGGPIVLFLDDAECMDETSAQLLAGLSTVTAESSNLLLLLAVRPEATQDPTHVLHETLTQTLPPTGRYTEIALNNMTLHQVHVLVARATRRPKPKENDTEPSPLQPLVDLLHQRTHGNCFFVVQLLKSLAEKNLLALNLMTLQWAWDIDQIQAETYISDNVLDLVAHKLSTLSKEARYVLVMASCLHSNGIELEVLAKICLDYFPKNARCKWDSWVSNHLEVLQRAIDSCPDTIKVEMDVWIQLDALVACGLMERVLPTVKGKSNTAVFKFAHERIRSAARGLIRSDEFEGQVLHVRVGELLWKMVTNTESTSQTWMLFACLDHLNRGPKVIIEEHQLELVKLNRQAAEKAVELSAFLPAAVHYAAGIDLLKQNSELMREHWVLLVKLRTQLSICHYRTGNLVESQTVAKSVLASSIALLDKLPLYYNLIAVYKAQGNLEEAVNIGIELLNQVGEKFSKKPSKMRITLEKQKVQKMLNKKKDKMTNLPLCTNQLKGAAVNVYAVLFGPMFHLGCPAAVDLLRLRSIYLTLKYGSTDASALAVAYYASHLISQGDIDGGYQFGKLSMQLLKKANSEELKSRTILVANFLSLHWKDPLSQTLDRLMEGYNVGMINGDIEMAFTNAGLYQTHYYYCGLPLNTGEKDLKKFIKQMEEYGQHKELSQYKPLWQTMLNLMGKSKVGPTVMTGDAMDQTKFEQGKLGVVVMKSYRMQLAYYFEDLDLAKSLMDELRPQSNFTPPFFQTARRFFFALIRLGLARKAPVSKRSALIKKITKEDIQWLEVRVRAGAINCLHKLLILKAEVATFSASPDDIDEAFRKATTTAGRSGFSQDEALANELAAAHFLANGNFQKASDYLSRAYELYGDWGARGKVKQLEAKYVLIKPPGSTSGNSSSTTKRKSRQQRFSPNMKFSNVNKDRSSSGAIKGFSSDRSNEQEGKGTKQQRPSLTSQTMGSGLTLSVT